MNREKITHVITWLIVIILFLFMFMSCHEEVVTEPQDAGIDYQGCWTEISNSTGHYDIIIDRINSNDYEFYFGSECIRSIATMNEAYIRADTLIITTHSIEYWTYIHNDTLMYSSDTPGSSLIQYIKAP